MQCNLAWPLCAGATGCGVRCLRRACTAALCVPCRGACCCHCVGGCCFAGCCYPNSRAQESGGTSISVIWHLARLNRLSYLEQGRHGSRLPGVHRQRRRWLASNRRPCGRQPAGSIRGGGCAADGGRGAGGGGGAGAGAARPPQDRRWATRRLSCWRHISSIGCGHEDTTYRHTGLVQAASRSSSS